MGDDLAAAVATWRVAPSAALADEIDRLSAMKLLAWRLPPGVKELDDEWRRVAADDPSEAATAWLARTLREQLRRSFPSYVDAINDRIARIAPRAPDPRIAAALVALVARVPFPGDPAIVYAPALSLIDRCGDVRQIAALRRIVASPRSPYLVEAIPPIIARLVPPAAEEAPLLAAIHADPAADAPRSVYADWLSERGDPRGELIALQLRGDRGDEPRVRALLRTNAPGWLGGVGVAVTNPIFRRGFLAGFDLDRRWLARGDDWERFRRDPTLTTVEEIHQGNAKAKHLVKLYGAEALRSLRVVEARSLVALEAVSARPITHVQLTQELLDHPILQQIPTLSSIGFYVAWGPLRFDKGLPPLTTTLAIRQTPRDIEASHFTDLARILQTTSQLQRLIVHLRDDASAEVRVTYVRGGETSVIARFPEARRPEFETKLPATGADRIVVSEPPRAPWPGVAVEVRSPAEISDSLWSFV
jgi:uncharacterized protein (TIGR02996 family)